MYQIALWAMGPRLAVQIVETSSFQEMEISILDAAAKWSDDRFNIAQFPISGQVYRGKYGPCTN